MKPGARYFTPATKARRLINETDAYGCHITIEKLDSGLFDVTVSYKSYNALGVHVASPMFGTVGTGSEVYAFIFQVVANACNHNKPILDIRGLLES